MNIQWDPKVGPATISAIVGTLLILIGGGVMWGSTTTKLDTVIEDNKETKKVVSAQDKKVAEQAVEISAMKSTLSYIVPTIQRIEAAITPTPGPPNIRLPARP